MFFWTKTGLKSKSCPAQKTHEKGLILSFDTYLFSSYYVPNPLADARLTAASKAMFLLSWSLLPIDVKRC